MRIERHSAVIEEDLPAIYAFIAQANPDAAERLLVALEEVLTHLMEHPDMGVIYTTRNPQMKPVRMLPVSKTYLLFYRIEEDAVRVLYIVHGSRHLPRLFKIEPRA